MRNAPALQIMGWEINLLGDDRGEGGGVLATDTLEAVGRRQGRQKDAFSKYHENSKIWKTHNLHHWFWMALQVEQGRMVSVQTAQSH